MRVLSFGAAGPIGGLAVPAFAGRGLTVRGFVRDADGEAAARAAGAAESAVGDMTDAGDVEAALAGVDAVFYIAPVDLPDQDEVGRRIVRQAEKAGIRRFVFSSVIHPILALPNHRGKAPVEDALVSSGMTYAVLHPAVLFQNLARSWPDIAEKHVLAEPWSSDSRFARVDYRDVAEVAAIAMTEDRLDDGTFELCAPGLLDRHQVAALAAEVLGRPVEARRIDPGTLPDDNPLRPMAEHYDRHGLRGNGLTLTAILGREPRTLKAYFEELAQGR